MKTLKTALSLLMVFCMILSFGTAAFAQGDNPEGTTVSEVIPEDTMNNNNGTIGIAGNPETGNFGLVITNGETGTITINQAGGNVLENNGQINTNAAKSGAKDAGQVGTNNGTIGATAVDENGYLNLIDGTGNYGTVGTNGKDGTIVINREEGGVVEKNEGAIGRIVNDQYYGGNNGTVKENAASGTITLNDGEITDNAGFVRRNDKTITNNTGTVHYNDPGTITNNSGTVRTNGSYGTITNNSGTVAANFGTVTNNYGGDVTNKGGGKVEKQYIYSVEFETEYAAAAKETTGDLSLYEGKYWLKDGSADGGSVEVTPDYGYTLAKPTLDSESGTLTAEGSETGGWKLTFTGLLKNIKLFLKGEKIADPEPQPNPKPDPKPAAAATDLSFSAVKFTFNLAGGTLDGETGKVIKWFVPGATVKLPAAPTKPDSTFAGWQTRIGDEVKVFQAGEKFTVTGAQNFTALWD